MMGADTPIPQVVINVRRPESRPVAASISFLMKQFFVGVSLFLVIQRHHLRPRPPGGRAGSKGG